MAASRIEKKKGKREFFQEPQETKNFRIYSTVKEWKNCDSYEERRKKTKDLARKRVSTNRADLFPSD